MPKILNIKIIMSLIYTVSVGSSWAQDDSKKDSLQKKLISAYPKISCEILLLTPQQLHKQNAKWLKILSRTNAKVRSENIVEILKRESKIDSSQEIVSKENNTGIKGQHTINLQSIEKIMQLRALTPEVAVPSDYQSSMDSSKHKFSGLSVSPNRDYYILKPASESTQHRHGSGPILFQVDQMGRPNNIQALFADPTHNVNRYLQFTHFNGMDYSIDFLSSSMARTILYPVDASITADKIEARKRLVDVYFSDFSKSHKKLETLSQKAKFHFANVVALDSNMYLVEKLQNVDMAGRKNIPEMAVLYYDPNYDEVLVVAQFKLFPTDAHELYENVFSKAGREISSIAWKQKFIGNAFHQDIHIFGLHSNFSIQMDYAKGDLVMTVSPEKIRHYNYIETDEIYLSPVKVQKSDDAQVLNEHIILTRVLDVTSMKYRSLIEKMDEEGRVIEAWNVPEVSSLKKLYKKDDYYVGFYEGTDSVTHPQGILYLYPNGQTKLELISSYTKVKSDILVTGNKIFALRDSTDEIPDSQIFVWDLK